MALALISPTSKPVVVISLVGLTTFLGIAGCARHTPLSTDAGPVPGAASEGSPDGGAGRHRGVDGGANAGADVAMLKGASDATSPGDGPMADTSHADGGGADAEEGSAPSRGAWIDRRIYRFRLDDIRRCEPDVQSASADPGELRIGFAVRIESHAESFAPSPRDVTLESGGIITQAELPGQKPSRGCAPALPLRPLKPGQTARGFAEFRIAPSLRTTATPLVLAYRPTRWGGGGRVEIKLPTCFGLPKACLDESADSAAAAPQPSSASKRAAPRSRRRGGAPQ